jgi:hypothetical protein
MSPKKQKQLFDKYPEIFLSKDKPIKETSMRWGIECDDGWYSIIESLCFNIQNYCDSYEYVPKRNSSVNFTYRLWNNTIWSYLLRPLSSWWFLKRKGIRVPDMYHITHPDAKKYNAQWEKYYAFEKKWRFVIHTARKKFTRTITFDQIKRNLGGLRIYARSCDSYVQGLIDMAEEMSYHICETCGTSKGVFQSNTKGWIRITCKECNKKKKSNANNH